MCLGYVPALACGSCRGSGQGTTLRASDHHNARATILRPCLIGPKPDLDFKIRILKPWGCKQTGCWIRIRFLENKCIIWIKVLSRCQYLSILSKCHCVVSLTFYCEIVDCKLLKQIVLSFHWHLPIAVRHLESNESGSGAGFMVSRIRIRFQRIWPKQTQRILKPVSVLV